MVWDSSPRPRDQPTPPPNLGSFQCGIVAVLASMVGHQGKVENIARYVITKR